MRHASLFTGIGGFDLAAQWMVWENVFQVEIDQFCQKVLEKNFPGVARYGDIKQFNGTKYRGAVDILTGGFPCQPYSTAGKRKGKEDDRHLWPEMLRVIREVQPGYVVGENVRGLTNWSGGLVFDEVQADLEAEGYEVLPFLLPACAVNAPHRRDRIWFIAYSGDILHAGELVNGGNSGEARRGKSGDKSKRETSFGERVRTESFTSSQIVTDSTSKRLRETREDSERSKKRTSGVGGEWTTPDTNSHQRPKRGLHTEGFKTTERHTGTLNSCDDGGKWKDFPTQSPVCRGNDGIPNRVDRIKSLGNAIVPQVAFEIFKAIEVVYLTSNVK